MYKVDLLKNLNLALKNNITWSAIAIINHQKINNYNNGIPEIILIHQYNLIDKITYYSSAYDDYCFLNTNKNIEIIKCSVGENIQDIINYLL